MELCPPDFLTKVPKIYDAEIITSLTTVAGNTGYLHA
jgi:hypothetical protein